MVSEAGGTGPPCWKIGRVKAEVMESVDEILKQMVEARPAPNE